MSEHIETAIAIAHEEANGRGAFFVERDGQRIAVMTYRRVGERLVVIDHTEVDASLKGMGVARRLLDAAVAWARESATKLSATCSYATAQFDKDPSIRDVLAG